MPIWESPHHVKIHENCGGAVEWREATHTPSVGYFGHCLACQADEIVQERIIPLEVGSDVDYRQAVWSAPLELMASLRWAEDDDWEENQDRLRVAVMNGGEVGR